jgi:hypothetical protein
MTNLTIPNTEKTNQEKTDYSSTKENKQKQVKKAHNASKRIVAEIEGDKAIELGILIEMLGLAYMPKRDADLLFIKLAMISINYVIPKCSAKIGKKYPSIDDLIVFLRNDEELKPADTIEVIPEIINTATVEAIDTSKMIPMQTPSI